MDLDIFEGVGTVQDLVKGVAKNLKDPLNDLSDLAEMSRTLRLAAECLETYVGVQHARYERDAEELAGFAGIDMRNNHHQ